MFVDILHQDSTDVKSDFEKIPDSYEDLITALHRFLDRLVAEPEPSSEFDLTEIFIEGSQR